MSWPAIPLIQYAEMPAVLHDMTCLRSRIYLVFSEVTKLEWGPSEWSSPTMTAAFLKCRIQIDMHRGTVICGEARTLCEKGRKSWEWCTYRPTCFQQNFKAKVEPLNKFFHRTVREILNLKHLQFHQPPHCWRDGWSHHACISLLRCRKIFGRQPKFHFLLFNVGCCSCR